MNFFTKSLSIGENIPQSQEQTCTKVL